ncbi:hypothetical protein KHA96_07145 [Bacillus sp. FJAT-49711]|nr:hypothetical protein [Bacillus sp. FJAT-49711]MBS4218099.1 hypothetical protein [Bacillus sp. FJAT-49711]
MKNPKKQDENRDNNFRDHPQQSVEDYFEQDSGKPISQPKDYEEIDY